MIRDGEVLIAEAARRLHHALAGVASVAPGGVGVQIAANVGQCQELRQPVLFGLGHFASVLAQFGRDVRELETRVDDVFAGRLDARSRRGAACRPRSRSRARALARGWPRCGGDSRCAEQRRPGVLRRREVNRRGAFLGAHGNRLVGAAQHAERGPQPAQTVEQLRLAILRRHGQERDVTNLGSEAPEATDGDERGHGESRSLHVMRDRRGESVSAAEGQTGEFQARSIDSRRKGERVGMGRRARVAAVCSVL